MPDSLARSHDVLLLDLDGVVYVSGHEVSHAARSLRDAGLAGARVCYVTNNASRTPRDVAEQLRGFGLDASDDDVVTSAQAGAQLLADSLPSGSRVLAVGGTGVGQALRERGLTVVDALADPLVPEGDAVAAVLQGFGKDLNWIALARAARAVGGGAVWVATNDDMTIPTDFGVAPGNGTLVAAVAAATGRTPQVVGKPRPTLLREAVERTGADRPLVVGDRLDTDMEGARNAGLVSLLVLTGVTKTLDLWRAPGHRRPDHIGTDLRALLRPALVVNAERCGTSCLDASASVERNRLVASWNDDPAAAVWAAAHLLWTIETEPENTVEVAGSLDVAVRRVVAAS